MTTTSAELDVIESQGGMRQLDEELAALLLGGRLKTGNSSTAQNRQLRRAERDQ